MKPMLALSREMLNDTYLKWFAREDIRQEFAEWQKQQPRDPCAAPAQGVLSENLEGGEPILVDESSQQFIRVAFNTARPMAQSVVFALMKAVRSMNQQQESQLETLRRRGEQSPRDLNAQGREVKVIHLPKDDLEALRAELNQYGVDFAVKPNGTENCEVLYKFQDVAQVEAAVHNVLKTSVVDLSRTGKDLAKTAVQASSKQPLADRLAAATKIAAERNAAIAPQQPEQVLDHTKDNITR